MAGGTADFARKCTAREEFEHTVVEQYTRRLLALARKQMSESLRSRMDPDDVVQSVYQCFFRRFRGGELSICDASDVWRLLSTITLQKTSEAARYHCQKKRDVRREIPIENDELSVTGPELSQGRELDPKNVAILNEAFELFVHSLSADYREILLLQLQGLTIDKIAVVVSRSRRTVFRVLSELEALAVDRMENPNAT